MAEIAGLLDEARGAKAKGAEVLFEDTESFHAVSSRGSVDRAVSSESHRVTVRVWDAQGRAAGLAGEAHQARQILDECLSRMSGGSPDPHGGPVGRGATQGGTSDIDDRRYGGLTREDRLDVLVTAERVARNVDRSFETFGFSYRDARTQRFFGNSRNVRLKEAGTVFRVEGTVRSPKLDLSLSEVVQDRAFATVASLPFGASLARRLVELDGERTEVDGPCRVMLPPRVVAEIIALLGPHFRHEALQRGSSFLSRARSGGNLTLSPLLHVVDDGRLSGALNATGFDERGVSPVPLTLIRDGRVDGWYLDVAEARQAGVRPTGHRRAGRLMPGNLLVRGGSRSMNALLAEQTEPVVVLDHARGLLDGVDLTSGDLSFAASGHLIVPRNRNAGFLQRMKVTGNLIEVLSSVVGLASDTDRIEHVDAPGIMVDGLTIATAS